MLSCFTVAQPLLSPIVAVCASIGQRGRCVGEGESDSPQLSSSPHSAVVNDMPQRGKEQGERWVQLHPPSPHMQALRSSAVAALHAQGEPAATHNTAAPLSPSAALICCTWEGETLQPRYIGILCDHYFLFRACVNRLLFSSDNFYVPIQI